MPTLYPSTAPLTVYPGEDTPANYPVQNNPNGAATSVVRGLKSALTNVDAGSAATAYYEALAAGDVPRAQANGLRAQQLAAEAARAAPRVQSVGDIHGAGDFVDWGAGVLGAAPVSMVPAMAGGLAGAAAARFGGNRALSALGGMGGAGAGMYPQLVDAARLQHSQSVQAGAPELPAQQVLDDTSQQAMWQAGVESLVPGLAGGSLVGPASRAAMTNPLRATVGRVGRDMALDSGAAAVSEGVAMNYETGRDANRDTSGDTMRYIDAAASEAVPGAGYGVLGAAGDLAHTALGGTLDAAGKGGAYAARLAEQGGAAGAAKAKEMWDNRPKTLDEAAVMVGEGAAKLHNQAEDAVTRLAQRGKDPDVDTLLAKRAGKTEADMRADDVTKHAAAANFIAKNQANTGDLPPYVQAAMADYAAKPNAPFSWEPLADAVNDMHRAQGLGESLQRFADEAAIKLGKGAADARNAMDDAATAYAGKRQADGRANAQTPDMQFDIEAARDELSPLLDEALAPLTGLKSQDALDNALPSLNYALRTWVQNNFSMKPDGEPVVPKALLDMFTDPAKAVQTTVDLLHRQGLVDDSVLPLRDRVLEQIQVKQLARQQAGTIIDDMLVPTKAKGLTAVDHDLIAEDLMDRLQRDEVSTAEAKALFGPRARVALDALWAKINAARPKDAEVETEQGGLATRTGYDEGDSVLDGEDDGSGDSFEELDQMTNARDPSQDKADTTYHPYNPKTQEPFKVGGLSTNPETGEAIARHDEKAPQRIAELQAKGGGEVKRVGYMDYLREKHGNDGKELMNDAISFLQRHEKEIRTITDKAMAERQKMIDSYTGSDRKGYIASLKRIPSPEEIVNKNWYMLKEVAGRKGEGTDATVASLGREGNKGQIIDNEWAERSDGEHGTVKEGRIWLERELSDGSTTEFATSTGRIISRMARARKGDGKVDESNGLAGQVTLLRQGLASLLSASYNAPGPGKYGKSLSGKSGKGEPVLTGRVGFKQTADDDIVWLAEGDDLPDNLRMHSSTGQTYAQAKAAAKTQRDDELVAWAKRQLELIKGRVSDSSDRGYKGAMMDLQRMEQALKKPDLDELDQLRREDDYRREKEQNEVKPLTTNARGKPVMRNEVQRNADGEAKATSERAAQKNMGDHATKRAALDAITNIRAKGFTHEMRAVKTGPKRWSVMADVMVRKGYAEPDGEISEMGVTSNFRSRQEDSSNDKSGRNVDELTREALHTDKRETAAAKSDRDALAAKADAAAAAKQARAERTAFLLDALRQGVPAFNALARKLPDARRAALLTHLKAMLDAKTADNPIWGGKPPKDLGAFANRARAALVALGEMKGDTKKPVAKVEVATPSAAPAQTVPDVLKRMNDYLDNPPDDYNVKQLEVIRDWATKQEARLNEAKSKHKEGSDEWERLDDLRFEATLLKAKATKAIKTEAEVEAHHAEQGGPRYNKQAADPAHGALGTAPAPSAEEQAKFHADILRRLGPQMKSALLDVLVGKGARGKDIYLSGKWEKGAIYASLYARNIGQVGAHEAFHEFFSRLKGEPAAAGVLTILERAANSPFVTRQLERLLDGEKEALRQINPKTKHSAEERMAYMFQFWQAGLLKIGPETQSVFTKLANFFRNVVGMLTNDQKADKLLRMFDQGHMQTPDAAARVLAGVEARGSAVRALNKAFRPALERGSRLINTAETHLHNQGKEYDHIRRLFKRSVGESGGQGFFDAKDHQMKMWGSKLADILGDATPKDLELAAGYLHSGKAPTDKVVARLVREIKGPNGLLPQLYKYLDAAGVERMVDTPDGKKTWEEMGKVEHYFPRAYDTAKIATDTEGFVADLMKYNQADLERAAAATNAELKLTGDEAQTAEGVARAIANRLVNGFGQADLSETDSGVGFSPFMRAVNRRSLHWLAPEILAKYGEKDVARVLTTYIAQATKRAEYVRRFGNGGHKLKEMLEDAHTHRLDALAEKEFGPNAKGIYSTTKGEDPADRRRIIEAALTTAGKTDVKERLDALELKALKVANNAAKDVMAMEGTLGYDIKPGLRRFNNTVMVYENMRLLSTSLFSQFIDPLGMVVRGATMSDAWNAYKRGLREVVASIKGERINDLDAKIAGMVGTADMNGFLAAYGQAYGSQFLGEKFRNVNEQLFRFNGMEGFNRGMQVAGTRAAINFIKRHVESPSANSKAYLAELNLKAADVKLVDGELDYTNPRIARAIHQWVNGAVLRPNAAQRPAWASDPHFMLFWHMKQFAYTFHDVILKRALHNYKQYGDIGPASVLLAGYIPVMIASDAAKSLLLTGDEPVWMKQGLDSEVQHGAMRAGLLGKFQPLADVAAPNHTVLGVAGPAVEQIAELFTDTPGQSAINALPGSNVINAVKGHSLIEGHSDY